MTLGTTTEGRIDAGARPGRRWMWVAALIGGLVLLVPVGMSLLSGDLQHTAAPSVTDGVAYYSSEQGSVYAVDLQNHEQRWRFDTEAAKGWRGWLPTWLPGPWLFTTPAVEDGVAYFGSYEGNVYAVDAATGEERWRFPTGDVSFGGPVLVDDTLYVASWDDGLYAISTAGEERWRFETEAGLFSWPAPPVIDDTIYLGALDGQFYAVDRHSGEERWSFATGDAIATAPAVAGDLVFISSFDGSGYALDRETGEEVWRHHTGAAVGSPPSHVDGTVYFGNHDGVLLALAADTGRELWRTELGGILHSPIVVVDGTVVVSSHDGAIHGVEAASGHPQWTVEEPAPLLAPSLTADDDGILFSLLDESLYRLDPKTGRTERVFPSNREGH